MENWLAEWSTHVLPLRRAFGFEVIGPWVSEDEDLFVWILGYDGDEGWASADSAYYDSSERRALTPDPARHLLKTEQWMVRSVPANPA